MVHHVKRLSIFSLDVPTEKFRRLYVRVIILEHAKTTLILRDAGSEGI